MSAAAARTKNREDLEKQVQLLQEEYNRCGLAVDLVFKMEPVAGANSEKYNARLSVAHPASEITYWTHYRTADIWLALFDMRCAVSKIADRLGQ